MCERLAPFFRALRSGLAERAERSQPRICLLTPGPYSETYFEQAYLARYLGFLLVEGDDLVVRDGKVHVRTIAGLEARRRDLAARRCRLRRSARAERRLATRRPRPALGDPRRRRTVVANMPGSGFVESRALMSFMPRSARHLLGRRSDDAEYRDLVVRPERGHAQEVLANLDTLAISGAFSERVPGFDDPAARSLPAKLSTARPRAAARARSRRAASTMSGRRVVQLSTTPVWHDGQLVPRPFVLRVYAAATPDGWHVMPGGFCRISDTARCARGISMGEGVQSADVWVLSTKPVAIETLLPAHRERPHPPHSRQSAEPRRRQSVLVRPLSRARRSDAARRALPVRAQRRVRSTARRRCRRTARPGPHADRLGRDRRRRWRTRQRR